MPDAICTFTDHRTALRIELMVKALLLLGILLILIDLYENLWLRRKLKAEDEDKITGGHLFRIRGVRIYRTYLGVMLILLWLLVR